MHQKTFSSGFEKHRTKTRKERFFRGRAQQGWIAERKAMIDRESKLSIGQQARLLGISRGSEY